MMVLVLFSLMLIAHFSTRSILQGILQIQLSQKSQQVMDSLVLGESTFKINTQRLDPLYHSQGSGRYYAVGLIVDSKPIKQKKSPFLANTKIPLVVNNEPLLFHDIAGPAGDYLVVLCTTYYIESKTVVISIAEDMSVIKGKNRYFSLLFIGIGLVGFVLVLLVQKVVLRTAFKSLDDSREEINKIEAGEIQQLSALVPSEIYPLVKEFNYSLSIMQQRTERSRHSLGNLTHALKNPLHVLMLELDSFEGELNHHNKQSLKHARLQVERLCQLTERELKRARLAGLGHCVERFEAVSELPTLIEVLKKVYPQKQIDFQLTVDKSIIPFGDREDMLELLGNLLDNAFKWAESVVSCKVNQSEDNLFTYIITEDDGSGQSDEALVQLTQRGARLDESIEGHGLGLAICMDIVKLYNGTIELAKSETLGGFKVMIKLQTHFQGFESENKL